MSRPTETAERTEYRKQEKSVRVKMRYEGRHEDRISDGGETRQGYEKRRNGRERREEKRDGEKERRKICGTFNRRVGGSSEEYLKERHWKSLSARISSILNIKWAMRFFPPRGKVRGR